MPNYKITLKNTTLIAGKNDRRGFGDEIDLPEIEGDRLVARGVLERLVPIEVPAKASKTKKEDTPTPPVILPDAANA